MPMPLLFDVCGWSHCKQHIPDGAPGGLHRHYSVKHASRYPPDSGYESEEEPLDEDAALLDRVFWAAAEGRRGAEAEEGEGAAAKDGSRAFVEEHYPGAGWACDKDGQFLEEQSPAPRRERLVDPDAPFTPFDDERQYGWAESISKYRMSKAQVDAHMRRHAAQEPTAPAFTNFAQFRKKVDEIEYGPEWATWRQQNFKAEPTDLPPDAYEFFPFLEDIQTFYYRDTNLVLADLLRNPTFVGRQTYSPVRHSLPDGAFITEPHTAHNAWAVQEKLKRGVTQVRLTVASDATQLSQASGLASLHPVYLSTSLNDASLIREDRGALVVVGFIPILKILTQLSVLQPMRPAARAERCSRDTRDRVLLEPLRDILEADQLRQTADGWWRWCRAYMGCQPVDYPEGGWLLCVLKSWVVCCEAPPNELGDGPGIPRTSESSAAHRALGADHARSVGLHMEVPYYDRFKINGHALIISDLLHQLTKGVFKDLTLDSMIKVYLKNAAGGGRPYDRVMREIARRLEVLPPFSNLRRFKDGIEYTKWTGEDSKALMAVISAALWGRNCLLTCSSAQSDPVQSVDLSWGEAGTETFKTALDEVTQSITLVVIIYRYASSLESTATDRVIQSEAIRLYMEVIRYAFEDEREAKGFNWARLHSMFHYVEWTEANGTAPHSDTAPYETAHIKAVKLPYRASNRCNAIVQILRSNTRRDCLASLRGRLELAGTITAARPMLLPVYQEPVTVLPGRGDRSKRMHLQDLADARALPGFVQAASTFLSAYLDIPDYFYAGKVEVHTIATATFPVYARPAYLSNDTCKFMTQRLYATPDYPYRGEVGSVRGPRHDTLLVRGSRWAELGGQSFDAYDVLRARMFFVVAYRGRRIELCLGEEYAKDPQHASRRAVMSPVVHPVDVGTEPALRVFLVSDILRAVHLQPLFGKQGVPKELKFTETLDRWRGCYAVGVFTDQHIFRLLFRPEAADYLRAVPQV
ncbi:hypothetical protein P7C70_g4748, partial [Phenoliferia sp. Uapishka_3]